MTIVTDPGDPRAYRRGPEDPEPLTNGGKIDAALWWIDAYSDAEGRERRRLENWKPKIEDWLEDVHSELEGENA